MLKKLAILLSVIICSSVNANQAEVLKKLAEEKPSEQKKEKYEGDSLAYNLYDSTANGLKGALVAGVATPLTVGLAALYFDVQALDLLIKKGLLFTSNAEKFGGKSREELEKETALRELTNRFAKATISTGIVAIVIAIIFPR